MLALEPALNINALRGVSEQNRASVIANIEIVSHFEQWHFELYLSAVANVFFEEETDVQPENVFTRFVHLAKYGKMRRNLWESAGEYSTLRIPSQGFRVKSLHNKQKASHLALSVRDTGQKLQYMCYNGT